MIRDRKESSFPHAYPESRAFGECGEIEPFRRLTGALADISESIRERSRIATGTSFPFCGREPAPAGAAAGSRTAVRGARRCVNPALTTSTTWFTKTPQTLVAWKRVRCN